MTSPIPTRLPRLSIVVSWILALFIGVIVFAGADTAAAKSGFLGDFNANYSTAGTPLDSCSLCHTSVPALNGYGTDWKNNGKSFSAIEGTDSDGDGWPNLQEIQALTMPGNASSTPPPATTTTQPPGTTTTQPPGTTTTAPPSTTTTLPPTGNGPLQFDFKDFNVPGSVDVTNGNVTREIKVKVEVDNAPSGSNVTADIQLWANGQLAQTITKTKKAEDDGEVELEAKFNFTFNTSHVPRIDWWAIAVVAGQASAPETASTTVNGPTPPTTTQPPVTTTQPPGTATTQPPVTSTTQAPTGGANGAAIYAASCAGCHGADGSGGFGGPVAGTSMGLSQVVAITADGANGMPGFSGQLSGAEIDAVSGYVLTLGGGGEPPVTTTTTLPPGTPPGSGAALYRQHCAGCHGANADGGPGGPLVGSSLSFAQQVSVTTHGSGGMPGFSSVLTGREIDSIVRYVQGLGGPGSTTTTTVPPDEESGPAIYGRLCAACHGRDGAGGSGGPILGTNYHGSSLVGVIGNGLGSMPGFGSQLNDGQMSRLAAYVDGLASGSIIPGDGEDGYGALLGEDGFVDPADNFAGHVSESGGTTGDGGVALGSELGASSPLPVGNPVGWTLALAIALFLIAVGSTITGAMPREIEEGAAS
jgi:mono/diheme cytochrome c family protein